MFEINFSEIVLIMVVALIVIGPERLPKVARTLGLLWGRAQRYIHGVRADIERDMHMEELRQLKQKVEQEAMSADQSTQQAVRTLDQHMQSLTVTEPTAAKPIAESKPKSIPVALPQANVQVQTPKVIETSGTVEGMTETKLDAPVKPQSVPIQQRFPID